MIDTEPEDAELCDVCGAIIIAYMNDYCPECGGCTNCCDCEEDY